MAVSTEWKNFEEALDKEYTEAFNAKSTLGIIKKTTALALKVAVNPVNYSQVIKDLTKAALELIPIGGLFLSTIVDLAWQKDENPIKKMLDDLRKELTELMDEKITDEYVSNLDIDYGLIATTLTKLENSINSGDDTPSTINTRGSNAQHVNRQFEKVIAYGENEKHKIATLHQYTTAVIGHVTFLTYMRKHGGNKKKFEYTHDDLAREYYVDTIREFLQKYLAHIYSTYMQGSSTFREKQQEIEKRHNLDSSNNTQDHLNALKQQKETIDKRLKEIQAVPGIPLDPNASERNRLLHRVGLLKKDIPLYEKLIKAYDDFYNTTWGSLALKELMQEYHLELKDLTPAGLHKNEKNGQTYYYDDKGNMLTGWHEINNKWSYFSPINNNSNYEHTQNLPLGATFNKGQRMYGWIKVIDDTDYNYYISPLDHNTNEWQPNQRTFNTGEMWVGWLQWQGTAGTHWYYFYNKRNSAIYKKPEGYRAHGCINTAEDIQSEKYEKFDESGKWIGRC
ncbi:insecticidal delta-endotoxin Cry8Ea1 family protein [Bacillus toyonensis]|uniref:insecticidal delta-endotoxin Cry8Ea1 family protein n=1 Tax=Bacillus toyonensis TaxID=155322 RepID=UPI003D64D08D